MDNQYATLENKNSTNGDTLEEKIREWEKRASLLSIKG